MIKEGDERKEARDSLEESIKDIRQKILQRQTIGEAAWQKFAELANQESDPFKKAVAEDLAAIHFTLNTMWLEIERLYTIEMVNAEKIKQLYTFIFTLPEVIEDKDVINRMLGRYGELRNKIKSLQEGMR